jgi:hypothetical protein
MELGTQLTAAQPARVGARNLAMIALAVCLLLAGLGAAWWYRYIGTPEYSLSQLGAAVKNQNYGKASYYVDQERIAGAISQSLIDALLAKYTRAIKTDPLPFTETRIEILRKLAPYLHDLALLGVQNGIRLLLSGNPLLTGTSHFSQLDLHNFSGVHVVRSTVNGDTADMILAGLPQPNPFNLAELTIRMARIPNTRQWRIEEIPDATAIFATTLDQEREPPATK